MARCDLEITQIQDSISVTAYTAAGREFASEVGNLEEWVGVPLDALVFNVMYKAHIRGLSFAVYQS